MGILEIAKKILKIKSPSDENRRHFSNMQSSKKNGQKKPVIMCRFCEGKKELYYENIYGDMYLSHFGKRKTLEVVPKGCPPYADCSCKEVVNSGALHMVFPINFCPECGKDLR